MHGDVRDGKGESDNNVRSKLSLQSESAEALRMMKIKLSENERFMWHRSKM